VNLAIDIDDISESGIAGGNPHTSTAEIGAKMVAFIVDYCAAFVAYFKTIQSKIEKEATQ